MSIYKRGAVYWIRFEFRGREIRKSAYTGVKSEAQEFERRIREKYARIARGDKPRVTFAEAREKFTNEYFVAQELAISSQERYLTSLTALETFFGNDHIDEISRSRIIDFANSRIAQQVSPEKDLACLSSLMSYMVDCEAIEINPVITVKRKLLRKKKARVRFLIKEQYEVLLEQCTFQQLREMITFAVETGLRLEEQLSLQWSQIDHKRHEVRLTNTKSKLPRQVPLSERAAAQLSAQPKRPGCPYIFTTVEGARYAWNVKGSPCFRKAWEGALRRAKIEEFTWHDLRHTFASWAIKGWHDWQDEKMPIADLSKWLGHQSLQMTMRYAHLDVDDLHSGINRTAQKPDQEQGIVNVKSL